jgi:hypothetical protein
VEQHEREESARLKDEEARKEILRLRILWKSIEMSLVTKRSATYRELLEQIWKDFNIAEDYYPRSRDPLETIRLRRYNSSQKAPMNAFDVSTQGGVKLSHLPLNEYTVRICCFLLVIVLCSCFVYVTTT